MSPTEIKKLRERLGMTQDRFAEALEVDRSSVAQWETGRTQPSPAKREILRFWRRRLEDRSPEDWKTFAAKAGGALSVALVLKYISQGN